MLRRGFGLFFLALAGLGIYALGYWQGQQVQSQAHMAYSRVDGAMVGRAVDASAAAGETAMGGTPAVSQGFDELLDAAAWFKLERWLVANNPVIDYSHGARLIKSLGAQVNKYDALAMRRVLRAYLDAQPNDAGALFMLSDLQQVSGMREAALETLFLILDFPSDEGIAANARRNADQIIRVIDGELKNRGALAEREAFWRHISQRVSSSDYYRYQWAAALADLKRWDEARRILAETGSTDIAQATLEELRERIESAQHGVQFTRDGDRLLSSATTPAGLSFTLLVDTGANITSLSRAALRLAAAQRLDETVNVRTANGVVTTGVYRIAEIEVQGRSFTDLRVIELPVDLPDIDGLLGLDILDELQALPPTSNPA